MGSSHAVVRKNIYESSSRPLEPYLARVKVAPLLSANQPVLHREAEEKLILSEEAENATQKLPAYLRPGFP